MPGHLFEGNPVDEDTKRRVTETPVHRLEKPADSTHSLIRGKQSPGGSVVKNLSAMQETWVQSLGQEDPWKKGMATHSSILAWRILWTEEPGRLQFMGLQRVRHD